MIPAARRSHHQPPLRRLLFLSKTAPFSFSVAFLTPPTFPAPAPRKRFFDPLPKKILGLPNPQRTTAAPPVPRAGAFRISRGPARRGIFAGAGVWYLLRPAGLWGWRIAGRSGGGWLALCCACGPARHGISARACAFSISRACPTVGAGGWLAVLPTAGAVRRPADRLPAVPTAAPIGAAHPDRLPPVDDLPPRPPAAPVCRSAAGQAGAAAEGIYRARYRPRIS